MRAQNEGVEVADLETLAAAATVAQGGMKVYQGFQTRKAADEEAGAIEQAAAIEAAGMRHRANETRAAGQQAARERKMKTDQVIGRQVALAAASGAGASGGTILDLIEETAGRGEEQRLVEMDKAESKARGMEDKASFGTWQAGTRSRALRKKGDAALTGSIFDGAITAGKGVAAYGQRAGWFDSDDAVSDDSDPRTGWRTRVYKPR